MPKVLYTRAPLGRANFTDMFDGFSDVSKGRQFAFRKVVVVRVTMKKMSNG